MVNPSDADEICKVNKGQFTASSDGWYIPQKKAVSMTKGSKRLKMERDAYKEAYFKSYDDNLKYQEMMKKTLADYDERASKSDKMVSNLNEQVSLLEKKNARLQSQSNTFKTLSLILTIVGVGVAVCR